ncbi:Uncharacterized membrane protein YfhO [Lachnospiraceae bacterium RM5]|nr:Uncharacterized membrane protein YfhO [Lachnospiraceae bacterium RM5]
MNKAKKIINETYLYVLAFIIPVIILLFVFNINNIYPFGSYTFIRSDLRSQNFPFFLDWQRKLQSGELTDYSWNAGLGFDYFPHFCYNLTSFSNVLLLLNIKIKDYIFIIFLIKTALASNSFFFYLKKKYNEKNILMVVFSVCYAMCAYNLSINSVAIIWMDIFLLFPILILLLERGIYKGKYGLYCIILAYMIYSNFYMGLIVCIFIAVIYLINFIFDYNNIKNKFKNFIRFSIYSLLSVFMSAIVIVPVGRWMMKTSIVGEKVGSIVLPDLNIIDVMRKSLIISINAPMDYYPILYCSVLSLIMVSIYFFSDKVVLKDKIKNGLIILLFSISFFNKYVMFFFSGFHITRGYYFRYNYILVFFILCMSYKAIKDISEIQDANYLLAILFAIAYVIVTWKINKKSDIYSLKSVYLSLFFIILYICIFIILRWRNSTKKILFYILLVCISFEFYINSRDTFVFVEQVYTLNEEVNLKKNNKDDDKFYRTILDSDFLKYSVENEGLLYNVYSLDSFSAIQDKNIIEFYENVGMMNSGHNTNNLITNIGNTAFIRSILSVKNVYNLGEYKFPFDKLNNISLDDKFELKEVMEQKYYENENLEMIDENVKISKYNTRSLLENKYVFSLGYLVDTSVKSFDFVEDEPIVNINNLYKKISGENDILYDELYVYNLDIEKTDYKKGYVKETTMDRDADLYFSFGKNYPITYDVLYSIVDNDGNVNKYSTKYYNAIIQISNLKKGEKVRVFIPKGLSVDLKMYADNNVSMEKCYNNLKDGFLKISSFKNDEIKGSIYAKKDEYMFMSIPYDDGWRVYVDGKRVKTEKMFNAFISVPMSKGKHNIVMRFVSPAKKMGLIISLVSIFIFILLSIYDLKKYNNGINNTEEK